MFASSIDLKAKDISCPGWKMTSDGVGIFDFVRDYPGNYIMQYKPAGKWHVDHHTHESKVKIELITNSIVNP